MPEPRRGSRLVQEALGHLVRRELAADELDGDVDVERLVVREPHVAHAALAQRSSEPVLVGDHVAGAVARWPSAELAARGAGHGVAVGLGRLGRHPQPGHGVLR